MATLTAEDARRAAASVPDPELPVLTLEDLGVLRDVTFHDGRVTVTLTPTYSGCPAMEVMERDVAEAVRRAGFLDVVVRRVLAPPWSSDDITDEGRRKLEEYGIAPPPQRRPDSGPVLLQLSVRCPQCGSTDTEEISRFGSTSCKALWRCRTCAEPFDHFKAL